MQEMFWGTEVVSVIPQVDKTFVLYLQSHALAPYCFIPWLVKTYYSGLKLL